MLGIRNWGCLLGPKSLEDQQQDSDGNAHIRHVENAGAEAADADVHEVDDASIVEQAIQEVAYTAAEDEAPGSDGEPRHLLGDEENNCQCDKPECRKHLEEHDSQLLGKSAAETQESPCVLGILQTNGIVEPRARRLKG